MTSKIYLAVLLWCLAGAVAAAWGEGAPQPETGCGGLMTELECRVHQETLARLPAGQERERYLKQHQALLAEREKSCRCQNIRAANSKTAK